MRIRFRATLVALCAACAACSNPQPEDAAKPAAPAAPIVGPRTVTGRVPAAIGGYPSIVILEPATPDTAPQATVPFMDQVQQTFIPQVLFVRTGQPMEFRNADEVLHNVRVSDANTRTSTLNISIPNSEKFAYVFQKDGFYDVGCDIHPAMAAQIVATTSPFAAAADAEGQFAIDNVTEGSYTASVYAGDKHFTRRITIGTANTALDLTNP